MKIRRSKRNARRNGVRKATYRSLSIITQAWADSVRFVAERRVAGTYGAAQGNLLSFWELDHADPVELPY